MLEVKLHMVNGDVHVLSGNTTTSNVLSPEGALTGLVGVSSRSDLSLPGRSGVLPGRPRFGAIQQDVEFYLHGDTGEEMEEVYRRFRQGWSSHKPCVLEVDADDLAGPWFLDLFLDRPLPGVSVDASRRTAMSLSVSVFSPRGLYRSARVAKSATEDGFSVTVTNIGDVIVYPDLVNSGSGGEVIMPSGATLTIPEGRSVYSFDPMSRRPAGVFPEGVPPGGSATWKIPKGSTLEWEILRADPWA